MVVEMLYSCSALAGGELGMASTKIGHQSIIHFPSFKSCTASTSQCRTWERRVFFPLLVGEYSDHNETLVQSTKFVSARTKTCFPQPCAVKNFVSRCSNGLIGT
jgi:hypothetical protein